MAKNDACKTNLSSIAHDQSYLANSECTLLALVQAFRFLPDSYVISVVLSILGLS